MTRVSSTHHILGIEHLLRQFGNRQCTVLLRSTRCQWSKACHEEVQARERNQVNCDLAEVAIELPRKAQAASDAAHCCADQVVQVAIGWCSELQRTEANVVQSFIV